MRQVFQDLEHGETLVEDVPTPSVRPGCLLIRTERSLVSAGTERMLLEFGKAGLFGKAKRQPEKVKQVLQKIRTDGIWPTVEAVRYKLAEPMPLGYCNVGRVIEVGEGVMEFGVGDRVVSNGPHADVVCVPTNLCAQVPANVRAEEAVFTVLGAIALQAIRLVQPTLGEVVGVFGLGLVGLLTTQILRASGCKVIAIDLHRERLTLAETFGAAVVDRSGGEDPISVARRLTDGHGVDAVVLAAATESSEPVSKAAAMCRKRGRIVLVGVTGLELSRKDFYEKELTFQVSCSYGPGRYDPEYEQKGHDYPRGYVRWTEQRNLGAVVDLIAAGAIDTEALVSHRVDVGDAAKAYQELLQSPKALGIVLTYGEDISLTDRIVIHHSGKRRAAPFEPTDACIAVLGLGAYASRVLIPALKAAGATISCAASRSGLNARSAKGLGIPEITTDIDSVFSRDDVNAVVIATRHDSHAQYALKALKRAKSVYVEKPLALTVAEIDEIEREMHSDPARIEKRLMVGFNRRFAPLVVRLRRMLAATSEPKCIVITVNAGVVPEDHWTRDLLLGGGRMVGEGCHFIDLTRHLADSPIESWQVMPARRHGLTAEDDKVSMNLRFADGSIGSVHYFGNGHRGFPKERVEVFCDGRVYAIDNFRTLKVWGGAKGRFRRTWRQDKGNQAAVGEFVRALQAGTPMPISMSETLEVSRVVVEVGERLRKQR